MLKDQDMMDHHLITEEVDGVEDKGSRDTTTIDVKTLGGVFERIPVVSLFH